MRPLRWKRLVYPLRSRRFPLRWKTFLKLFAIFVIPFALTGAWFIEAQRDATERLLFESFLLRSRLIAADLGSRLKDAAYLDAKNPALLARGLAGPDSSLPENMQLPPEFGLMLREMPADHRSLLHFFREPAQQDTGGDLRLAYALRNARHMELFLFDATFLEEAALASPDVYPE